MAEASTKLLEDSATADRREADAISDRAVGYDQTTVKPSAGVETTTLAANDQGSSMPMVIPSGTSLIEDQHGATRKSPTMATDTAMPVVPSLATNIANVTPKPTLAIGSRANTPSSAYHTPPQSPFADAEMATSTITDGQLDTTPVSLLKLPITGARTPMTDSGGGSSSSPRTEELATTPRSFGLDVFHDMAMDTPAAGPMPMWTTSRTTTTPAAVAFTPGRGATSTGDAARGVKAVFHVSVEIPVPAATTHGQETSGIDKGKQPLASQVAATFGSEPQLRLDPASLRLKTPTDGGSTPASGMDRAAEESLSHLFVIRGDLRKIACDAWMCPANAAGKIADYWEPETFGFTLPTIPATWATRECLVLPCGEWRPTGGQPWIANTSVGEKRQLSNIVDATRAFISQAATFLKSNNHAPAYWRERYLLCVPLAGTGNSQAMDLAGEIVGLVLPVIVATAREYQVDVCLATDQHVIYAAVQAWRARAKTQSITSSFAALSREERQQAEALADLAKRGDLVLFFGAGVSVGCGLPAWGQLLADLAKEAELTKEDMKKLDDQRTQALDVARLIAGRLTTAKMSKAICNLLKTPFYSLTHGLLACLPIDEAVTTNYEQLYEKACTAAGAETAVLPYVPNRKLTRWLCKMHGCVTRPDTIVLTREEYMSYLEHRGTLAGIVESLLLTKHMLFVGFSLTDENFHKIAREVRKSMKKLQHKEATTPDSATTTSIPSQAQAPTGAGPPTSTSAASTAAPTVSQPPPFTRTGSMAGSATREFVGTCFGTSLALKDDPLLTEMWKGDVNVIAMGPATAETAATARRLQIFLDYVLFRSTTMTNFLLNPRFERLLGDTESRFAAHVTTNLVRAVPNELQRLPAWRPVAEWLVNLGMSINLPPAPPILATSPASTSAAGFPPGSTVQGPGHVFIVHSDLKLVACDHWLVPTDSELGLPRRYVPDPLADDKRFDRRTQKDGSALGHTKFRRVEMEDQATAWAFDVQGARRHAVPREQLFNTLHEFLGAVASVCQSQPPRNGRARHLIALPLIGTGYSGRAVQSAEIIAGMLPILYQQVQTHGFDIVLVAYEATVYHACQEQRRGCRTTTSALRAYPQLQETVGRMAAAARAQSLVMIVGSALNTGQRSLGQMMNRYAELNLHFQARELAVFTAMPVVDKATVIARRDGGLDRFRAQVAQDLIRSSERASLAHVQMAGLDPNMIIITSADTVLESYFTARKQHHCVLPYDKADSSGSWILKMCGDPRTPQDIPMNRADLDHILTPNSGARAVGDVNLF